MTAIAHIITDSLYVREKPHKDAVEIGALKKGVSNVPDFEPVEIPIPDTSLAKMFAWVVGIIAACSALAYCVR
jgi:hypothetical protein